MGVTGLWTVVQPCARPVKLETLNKKRLAVDASIWIYQFLKAVRDKEGNALRNSHVVGFFRRICKLLFFGIKPVFVFDGGAPILKRQTVSSRKARREGRREDAVRTAGKLLALQMQRRAEEDDQKRREERDWHAQQDEEEPLPEKLVYVDELQMTAQERQQNRTFRKKDAYHLPNLDVDLADMGAPNDPRIMSHEELEEYARQFHNGEDVNIYDFSKIDFESPFFQSLPAADRYNILNAARLRSRLRMGYSKEQLDTMFPNRMDFSRFQVERVKERNELTQRLMNINGMNGEDAMSSINSGGRIAGEKGKEYVLVKNDGVEGGWALGVVSNKEGSERSKPIDVDTFDRRDVIDEADDDEEWEDDGFEDVPIEGLNRLPKTTTTTGIAQLDSTDIEKRRKVVYQSRQAKKPKPSIQAGEENGADENDSLFVPQDDAKQTDVGGEDDEEHDELFEDVEPPGDDAEEDELKRAIALSLEDPSEDTELPSFADSAKSGPRIDRPLDFNQKNARAGKEFARLANARAHGAAPRPFGEESDDEDAMDLQRALEESRRSMHKSKYGPRVHGFKRPDPQKAPPPNAAHDPWPSDDNGGFSGPLPFESLESISLGKSILGQKKKKPAKQEAGGFERDSEKEKPPQPLPPWFSGDIREDAAKQKSIEEKQLADAREEQRHPDIFETPRLQRQESNEIIDLDKSVQKSNEVITLDDNDDEEAESDDFEEISGSQALPVNEDVRMGDVSDLRRAEPPTTQIPSNSGAFSPRRGKQLSPEPEAEGPETQIEAGAETGEIASTATEEQLEEESEKEKEVLKDAMPEEAGEVDNSDEEIEWSESDREDEVQSPVGAAQATQPAGGPLQRRDSKSESSEFEDVESPKIADAPPMMEVSGSNRRSSPVDEPIDTIMTDRPLALPQEQSTDVDFLATYKDADEDGFSDPEDEELMRQMAAEAEEHARFAAELSSKSQTQSAEDYEKELRQLRNQQKKDRRDADEVTHIMVTECQQLLQLFGLPYVTAPMEAEAQCAELVSLGLVDGIVTDDSDCFLFGGTRIYKNMFNQAKFVECYLTSDLEKEYSLDRQKLIRFAHLLGSDYTEGLPSVGPVTALEILSEFDDLEKFSQWWSTVQLGQPLSATDAANPFRRKFRKNASKLFLPTTFPDLRVDHAYLHPEVDSDPQPFQWGVPDLDRLRQFLMATIGWSQERTDEVLVPVIRDMNRRENEGTQANITQFFGGGVGLGGRTPAAAAAGANGASTSGGGGSGGQGFAPGRRAENKSKRMETALGRLHDRAKDKKRRGAAGAGTGAGIGAADNENPAEAESQNGTLAHGNLDGEEAPPIEPESAAASSATATTATTAKGKKRKPASAASVKETETKKSKKSKKASNGKDDDHIDSVESDGEEENYDGEYVGHAAVRRGRKTRKVTRNA